MAILSALSAADFIPPAEGPIAFRRDQLPLDTEILANLSRQITTLADGLKVKTAAERRGAAQMLALSLAIDPGNAQARRLLEDFREGKHQPTDDDDKMEKDRARIWQYIKWLETPEAGAQGRALADCLKDVIMISDSEDPRADALRAAGERGAWAGWIPPLSAYETPVVIPAVSEDPPAAKVTEEKRALPILPTAQISIPLWRSDTTKKPVEWVPTVAKIRMTSEKAPLSDDGVVPPFSFAISSSGEAAAFSKVDHRVLKLLAKHHDPLPEGLRVTINSKLLQTPMESEKQMSISAGAALLGSAAITGREPVANLTLIGEIDETGAFILPKNFWKQLKLLEAKGRGRLVLPVQADYYLAAMLAFEKPEFFLNYEVLLAANFNEVLDYAAKSPPDRFAGAFAGFQEFREKVTLQTLRQQVANSPVRRRLSEIAKEVPGHASARMLAIQGSGNRPTKITREIMMCEIRCMIESITWLVETPPHQFTDDRLDMIGKSYESSRAFLDNLAHYAKKEERDILEDARELVVAVRTLDRAASRVRLTPDFLEAHASLAKLHERLEAYITRTSARNTDAR